MASEHPTSRVSQFPSTQGDRDMPTVSSDYSQTLLFKVLEGNRQIAEMVRSDFERDGNIAIAAIHELQRVGRKSTMEIVDNLEQALVYVLDRMKATLAAYQRELGNLSEESKAEIRNLFLGEIVQNAIEEIYGELSGNTLKIVQQTIRRMGEKALIAMEQVPAVDTWQTRAGYAVIVDQQPERVIQPEQISAPKPEPVTKRVHTEKISPPNPGPDTKFDWPVLLVIMVIILLIALFGAFIGHVVTSVW